MSRNEVRLVDRRAIEEYGLPGIVLMENAGRGCCELLYSLGIAGPVIISTIVLVSVGLLLSLFVAKIWPLDIYTAYLGTSPGAMSALIPLADDSPANVAFVGAFHFFRVVFIILIAPLIYKLIQMWSVQQ